MDDEDVQDILEWMAQDGNEGKQDDNMDDIFDNLEAELEAIRELYNNDWNSMPDLSPEKSRQDLQQTIISSSRKQKDDGRCTSSELNMIPNSKIFVKTTPNLKRPHSQ